MKRQHKLVRSLSAASIALALGLTAAISSAAASAGQAQGVWQQNDGKWYYMDADGSLKTGWLNLNDRYYYLFEDGHCAISQMTPDGYYVNENGEWFRRKNTILEQPVTAPERFIRPEQMGVVWENIESDLKKYQTVISSSFGKTRGLTLSKEAIEYKNSDKKILVGLYKDSPAAGYRLDLRTPIDAYAREKESTYFDYQMCYGILYEITSTPELVMDAIYQSWNGDNRYGIDRIRWTAAGDCELRYEGGDGYGKFFIRPRT